MTTAVRSSTSPVSRSPLRARTESGEPEPAGVVGPHRTISPAISQCNPRFPIRRPPRQTGCQVAICARRSRRLDANRLVATRICRSSYCRRRSQIRGLPLYYEVNRGGTIRAAEGGPLRKISLLVVNVRCCSAFRFGSTGALSSTPGWQRLPCASPLSLVV